MRCVVLILAAVAIVGLTSSPVRAAHGHGTWGGQVLNYGQSNHPAGCRCGCHSSGAYSGPQYTPYGYSPFGAYLGETHGQAVRRIMATHSRSRYHTHPRSMYNEPVGYGYGRW